jgi:hypothetical protein
LGDLRLVQRGFAAVGAALLGQGDALALPVPDKRSFELGERTHHGEQQGGHRGVLSGKGELFLHELHPHPLAGQRADGAPQIVEVAGPTGPSNAPAGCPGPRAWTSAWELVELDPGNAGYRRDLSISYERLAGLAAAEGRTTDARTLYQQGLDIARELVELDPGNAIYRNDVAWFQQRLTESSR